MWYIIRRPTIFLFKTRGVTFLFMSMVLDIGVLLIFLCFVVVGYRNGFVASLLSFIGLIVSFVISMYASKVVSSFLYLNFIKPNIILRIENSIVNGNKSVDGILDFLPSFIFDMINNKTTLVNNINSTVMENRVYATEMIVDLISPTILKLIDFVVIVVMFGILAILMRVVRKKALRFLNVPVLRQLDGILGMVLGAVKGVVLIIFLSIMLNVWTVLLGHPRNTVLIENINSTKIFKVFYSNDR